MLIIPKCTRGRDRLKLLTRMLRARCASAPTAKQIGLTNPYLVKPTEKSIGPILTIEPTSIDLID